ncbi:MAG: hypothetical protein AAGH41_00610 [Pseudomonadota bacterium]
MFQRKNIQKQLRFYKAFKKSCEQGLSVNELASLYKISESDAFRLATRYRLEDSFFEKLEAAVDEAHQRKMAP